VFGALLPALETRLKFFAWVCGKGDKIELDYVPKPKKVVKEIEKVWASYIKDSSGKPLYVESAMAQQM